MTNGNDIERVELSFEKFEDETDAKGIDEVVQRFHTGIERVEGWSKGCQADCVELWITGVMETGTVTRLIVSAKGEGGTKVVLKPQVEK